MNTKATKKKNQVITANIFEQQEMIAKAEVIRNNLKASTLKRKEVMVFCIYKHHTSINENCICW